MKQFFKAFTLIESLWVLALLALIFQFIDSTRQIRYRWQMKRDQAQLIHLIEQTRALALSTLQAYQLIPGHDYQWQLIDSHSRQVLWQVTIGNHDTQITWHGMSDFLEFHPDLTAATSAGRLSYQHKNLKQGFALCLNRYGRVRHCAKTLAQ